MPIYAYRCDRCGQQVEVLVRSSAAVPCCPHCGATLRERLLTVPYVRRRPAGNDRGATCCGREERCEAPPCSAGGTCRRG